MNRVKMREKRCYQALLLSAMILAGASANAETSTLTIAGNSLTGPPCVINGDQTISVDFTDEVMTTRVDGTNYRQPVPYTLECSGASNNALRMQIKGVNAGFSYALQTSNDDLGILLSNGDRTLPVNAWINFELPEQPNLFATLVKRPGTQLKAGLFTAAATMVVDYQ